VAVWCLVAGWGLITTEAVFYTIWARKEEKYIHSKQNRGRKKVKYKAEVKFSVFLMFARSLYIQVPVKLGMSLSLQKYELSCG